jgi:hypothetical protein
VDEHLKVLAEAGLDVTAAEEALDAGDPGPARDPLARAEDTLADLRTRWAGMSASERAIVGPTAADLRRRVEAALARLPKRAALGEGQAEHDAEQDLDPEAA